MNDARVAKIFVDSCAGPRNSNPAITCMTITSVWSKCWPPTVCRLLEGIAGMVVLRINPPVLSQSDYICLPGEIYANEHFHLLTKERLKASKYYFTFVLGSKALQILGRIKFKLIKHPVALNLLNRHCQVSTFWVKACTSLNFVLHC